MSTEGNGYRRNFYDSNKNFVKKTEVREGGIRGSIERWNSKRGFGFLCLPDGREVFCHVNELCEHIKPLRGQAPDVRIPVNIKEVNQSERGLSAKGVECDACAAPEQWELQPTGPEVFGVRRLEPVCINKRDAFLQSSTIPVEEIEKANRPFELAKRKKALWDSNILENEFFTQFGEPESIRVEDGDKIVLGYSHGEKTVNADSAMSSKHWEVAPSGQWKEEDGGIKSEFIFPDIPSAKVWKTVVFFHIHPILYEEFELLPEGVQREILVRVKERILSPEDIAEKRFNNFLKEDQGRREILELRNDICLLQVPGESYISSSTRKARLHEPLSPDERRGDSYYESDITTYSLTVGARKKERGGWGGDYQGGKSFIVSSSRGYDSGGPKETAEQIREKLITEKRRRLKELFDRTKKINPPSFDGRLYTLDSEEWMRRYETRWDEMQKAIEDQWGVEDAQSLSELKQNWGKYEEAAKDLMSARQEVEQAEELARTSRVRLKYNRPDWGNIGSGTIERIQEQTRALRDHALKLNKYISDAIEVREQEFRNERMEEEEKVRQQKLKEAADVEEFGATGRLLDIARSLAMEAGRKLGLEGAQTLFRDTCNASYGGAKRQGDIRDALGGDIGEETQSFLDLSKAKDINAVLRAASRVLESVDATVEAPKINMASSVAESFESEIASPEERIEELPQLNQPDKKGWWFHELPDGVRHSDRLNKSDRANYDSGNRIDVRCSSCPNNPFVGYLQK